MRGPVTATMRSPGTRSRASGSASTTRRSNGSPTPEPPTDTTHTRSSGSQPSPARRSSRDCIAEGSNPGAWPAIR